MWMNQVVVVVKKSAVDNLRLVRGKVTAYSQLNF